MDKLHRHGDDRDLGYSAPVPTHGTPGKSTLSGKLHRRAAPGRDDNGVAAGADAAVERAASSSGAPLPGELQEKFGASLGADLSSVRVHTGAESAGAAHAVGAKAYAVGQDIHFGEGQYNPSSEEGLFLIAHEVAHTVQQAGATPTRQHKLEVSTPGDAAEVEADVAARAMLDGGQARAVTSPVGVGRLIQREEVVEFDDDYIDESKTDDENRLRSGRADMERDDEKLRNAADAGEEYVEAHDDRAGMVASQSTKKDRAEIEGLIGTIESEQPNVNKAAVHDQFKGCEAVNAQTINELRALIQSMGESDYFLGGFKGAFVTARTDYVRLGRMAQQALKMAGAETGGGKDLSTVSDAFRSSSEGWGAGEDRGLSNQKGTGEGDDAKRLTETTPWTDYENARNQLATKSSKVTSEIGNVKNAQSAYKGYLHQTKAALAGKKAEGAEGALAAIHSDIARTAANIGSVVGLAGTILGGLTVPPSLGADAPDSASYKEGVKPDVKKMLKDEAAKAVGAKGLDAASLAEAAVKKIGEAANRAKISGLESRIRALHGEEDFHTAATIAAKAELEEGKFHKALADMVTHVTSFFEERKRVHQKADALVARAQAQGNPGAAMAIRFLGEADCFMPTADIAIEMGKEQQNQGEQAIKARRGIAPELPSWSTRETDKDGRSNAIYYRAYKVGKHYACQRVDVELVEGGAGSMMGATGAQNVVKAGLEELEKWKVEVRDLQKNVQSALGNLGDPTRTAAE